MQISDTLRLTQDLFSRASVTPADMGCQQVMMQRLAAAGFACEMLTYGSVDNLWARRGQRAGLCFAGTPTSAHRTARGREVRP